jgi:hypothetical protein
MCDKCTELDEQIARYRQFTASGFDSLTTERIQRLIDDLQRARDSMHSADRSAAE